MRKQIKIFLLLLIILPLSIMFVACGKNKSETPSSSVETPSSAIYYTVTFDSDGGSKVNAITNVESGSKIAEPIQPTKDGYTFDGWYFGEEKWNFVGYVVTENITLKAKWMKLLTVTFDSNGGIAVASITNIESGSKIQEPTKPTKEGYTFDGWYFGEEKWNFVGYVVTSNMILKAHWIENIPIIETYTVTFDSDGGTFVQSITGVESGSKISEPTEPTKDKYTFDGWYFGEGKWSFIKNIVREDITLKAKWTAINYSITYNLDGGTNNSNNPSSYTIESETITLLDPQKEYYTFKGWYNDINYNNQVTEIEKGSSGNKTFYAKFILADNQLKYKLSNDGTYYSVAGYFDGTEEEIVIKNTFNGLPVKYIYSNAFSDYTTLKKITIPENIIGIGNNTFYNCSRLTDVTFGENSQLTSIGDSAFYYCSRLTSIEIPSGVTSIGQYAFQNCRSLTSITIPSGVTRISYRAFQNCRSLTSIEIPSSVTIIGTYAFQYCSSLTSIILPGSVTSIQLNAFEGCSSLTDVYYNGTLSDWCKITYGDGSSKPMGYAKHFYIKNSKGEYEELTEIEIPSDITEIKSYTFSGFINLRKVIIPENVTNIGFYAFGNCYSLTSVVFENPNDWETVSTSLSSSDLSNPATAATYLKYTYIRYSWKRI